MHGRVNERGAERGACEGCGNPEITDEGSNGNLRVAFLFLSFSVLFIVKMIFLLVVFTLL